jgi:iron complex transport system substrate-binding protein
MPARRVVSLIASGTEMVAALGCGDRLVGRSHECDHPDWVRRLPAVSAPRFATDVASVSVDASVRALASAGESLYEVDAAALAALAPDLILTQAQCDVCAVTPRDVARATAAAPALAAQVLTLEPATLDDVWRDVRRVSEALGVPERGVQLVSRLRQRMRAIATRCASFVPRPRVAVLEWADPPMAAGHWTLELLAMAGAADALAGLESPTLSWERLASADPDLLWVIPCGFDLERARAEARALDARTAWRGLRAVREGHVYAADGNAFFHRPGPRLAESLEILTEAMHPRAFRFGHEGSGWSRVAG